jgi:copper homeostasis protein
LKSILEIAVFNPEAALIADQAGADRIELCSSYAEGGITPSWGAIRETKRLVKCEVFVMIRPRAGNFHYTEAEIAVMKSDIAQCKTLGADGIVLGCLDKDSLVDEALLKMFVELSNPLPVTFHRAFDLCHEPVEALEKLIHCGVKRILTSGQHASAAEGIELIAALNKKANGRITIMPGAGINPGNISMIAKASGCFEFHASAKRIFTGNDAYGFGENVLPHPEIIAELKRELLSL